MLLTDHDLPAAQQQSLRHALLATQIRNLKPKTKRTLSEFSESEIVLSPEGSRFPGRFSFANAEFQREVFDTLSDDRVRRVVVCAASQILKSQALINYIGYIISENPGPTLIVQPSKDMGESFVRERINPMLRDTPILWGRINQALIEDDNDIIENRTMRKTFAGGALNVASANSPADLASRPIRYLLLDEVDRYKVTAEGDPISIAEARTTTFQDISKTVLVSSPTEEDTSRIWKEFLASDQRYFHVPCPHCGCDQRLVWSQVKIDDSTGEVIANYVCEHCNELWSEYEKNEAVRRGRWVAHAQSEVVGFHISALYASWRSLTDLAVEHRKRYSDPEQNRAFRNTRLAEPWRNTYTSLDDMDFLSRLGDYTHEKLPNNVLAITAGFDVQGDRVEGEVVGWGLGDESWSLEYLVFHGQPTLPHVWEEVKEAILKKYKRADGVELSIAATCIDSGHAASNVYQFAAKMAGKGVKATKGYSGPNRPLFPTKASRGKDGYKVYVLGVDAGKQRLYDSLRVPSPGPGYCHFPKDRDDPEYYKQLTAEHFVTIYKKGKKTLKWDLRHGRRNEALDCRNYAMAARESLRLNLTNRKAKLDKLAEKKAEEQSRPIDETPIELDMDDNTPNRDINRPIRQQKFIPRRRGRWMQ